MVSDVYRNQNESTKRLADTNMVHKGKSSKLKNSLFKYN